jgi:hypothetical protein
LREKGREALASCPTDLVFGVVVSIAGCFRGRRVTGSALSLLGCRKPEAFTVHLQDMDMMAIARLGLETVDQIDNVKETAACAAANATARDPRFIEKTESEPSQRSKRVFQHNRP